MDKNAIKKFATWARRELIDRVRQQAYRFEVESEQADWQSNSARGVILTPAQQTQRQALIERMRAKGYEATIEEVAYTWFDRFCALRFMEVNGYLPGKTRMFSDDSGDFRPQILAEALSLELDGLNPDTVIQYKESNQNEELYKYLLQVMCNNLKPILTLFQPDDRSCITYARDYTWLLLPDNLLREGSVPEQMVRLIPEEDWKDAVQIVGWLYQYYNAEPKDQVFANLKKNIKISKKDIPAATQLFTPDWIVRYMVENSLGRLWVEGHPNDDLKATWKYYLEEAEQEPEVQEQLAKIRKEYAAIKPEEILCTDCCMGSGHILVYMFDVLVQIYEAYGYPTRDAVASIVKNNLWGLDIDDRATQLANFAVMMKARQYDKGWFRRGIQPHVMAIQESNEINRYQLGFLGVGLSDLERNNAMTQMNALLDEFIDAKEYGSILLPKEYDWELLRRFVRMTAQGQQVTMEEADIEGTQELLLQMIEQGQALAQKYHVVVTNPPYMGASGMGDKLAAFVRKKYPDSKSDMSTVCMERCLSMCVSFGYMSMINIPVWMFLSTYEPLRYKLLENNTLINMVHPGRGIFGSDFGTVTFVICEGLILGYKGTYYRLFKKQGEVDSVEEREQAFLSREGKYFAQQNDFKRIPGSPVAYWVSDNLLHDYLIGERLDKIAQPKQGIKTADKDRFLRLWHEVDFLRMSVCKGSIDKWFPCNKGGSFRKWYGNNEYVVNWENNGFEICNYRDEIGKLKSRPQNLQYMLREGITYTNISISSFGARYSPEGFIYDAAGSGIFCEDSIYLPYVLGFLTSSVAATITKISSPSMSFEVGQIGSLPFIYVPSKEIDQLVQYNISLSKDDWDSYETSWDFQMHPLVRLKPAMLSELRVYGAPGSGFEPGHEIHVGTVEQAYMAWESESEQRFIQLKENEEELNRIFIDIYGLQDELTPEVADKDVTVRKADLGRDIRSLISYAVGCMLGRYSLDKPGLQFAGGDWQQWLIGQEEMSYAPDRDGILPITDDEYFSDDIVAMFIEWVRLVFGAESLEENLKFIASALYPSSAGTARNLIRQYFLNEFYKDHLKIYQKRPIYWLFDSGKKNGFKCLVYMHRWAKDTVARVRTDYVHEMQSRYRTTMDDLSRRVEAAGGSERVRLQKQLAKIQGQNEELLRYEEKVHHLADQMIAIDLDDGVKHNYAIFEDILAPIK